MDWLSSGARDVPDRHRDLRNAIAWSYDLLGERERRLFESMATFEGGCTVGAAVAICSEPGEAERDLIDHLGALADCSLQRDHVEGEVRLVMLETIRQYATERLLAAGGEQAARNRHADYYLQLAEALNADLDEREEVRALRWFEHEQDNLRADLIWLRQSRRLVEFQRLCGAMYAYWEIERC